MNHFHCLIFRGSRNGATRREGNSKFHRATIQSHKFKAVEWASSHFPSPQTHGKPGPSSGPSTHAAGTLQFISQSLSRPRLAVCSPRNRAIKRPKSAAGRYQRRRCERQHGPVITPFWVCALSPNVGLNTQFIGGLGDPHAREKNARGSRATGNTAFRPRPRAVPIRSEANQRGVESLDLPGRGELPGK